MPAAATVDVHAELDRQLETLLAKGYPSLLGVGEATLRGWVEPLRVLDVPRVSAPGRVPFVVVVPGVPVSRAMEVVERRGRTGYEKLDPIAPERFRPIADVAVPAAPAYLLTDVDPGTAYLDVRPDDALPAIRAQGRSPLTIDEGIALVTQRPEALQHNACFSLLASRCGDKRVPALWLSAERPRLGWCWAGNPHTWLGSAHAGTRLAP